MFTRVLAPIDTHPDAIVSVALAEQIARHTHAELFLMRVVPDATSKGDVVAHRESLERLAADITVRGGLEPHIEVVTGRPDARILETAEREDVDLIVLAPHARAGLDALRHRSVTTRLISHTAVPLLVAPEHNIGSWPAGLLSAATSLVIVPVDGTALSEQAIGIGERIAETWERPLLLLRVIEPFSLYGAGPTTTLLERQLSEEDAQQAHSVLSNLRARVARQTNVAVEAMVKQGAADRVIAQAADSYPGSLIVMSTHGRKATERAVLGSVALNVLRRSHEPTLILPPMAVMRRAMAHAGATAELEW
ncbi:MAG TPA: universal stress protein [Ktedonobacterales bacterium]|jgi:nucleotide-binding universal stress UspA family protein|nr:universal stress protein [Ktedonobacterales bacterium]